MDPAPDPDPKRHPDPDPENTESITPLAFTYKGAKIEYRDRRRLRDTLLLAPSTMKALFLTAVLFRFALGQIPTMPTTPPICLDPKAISFALNVTVAQQACDSSCDLLQFSQVTLFTVTYMVTSLLCYMVGLTLIWVFHPGVQLLCQFWQISTFPRRQCDNQNKINPTM